MREAAADYLKRMRAAKGERAEADARQKLDSRVLPVLGDVKVADLTKGRIEAVASVARAAEPAEPDAERRARDTANRMLSALKAVLNHAFGDEANPHHDPHGMAARQAVPIRRPRPRGSLHGRSGPGADRGDG